MRPTALGWKALVFHALLTLAFYVSPYTNLFFLLLTFFVVLLAASALWTRHNLRAVRARVTVARSFPADTPGGDVEAGVDARRPCSGLTVEFRLAVGRGIAEVARIDVIEPGATRRVPGALPPLPRGVHAVRDWRIRSDAPLGLWSASAAVDGPSELVVHAAPLTRQAVRDSGLGDDGGAPSNAARSHGDLGVAGLRAWRHGDAVRAVHWRATARRRQPIVRECDPGAGPGLVVRLDRRCAAARLERALSALVTLARRAQTAGTPIEVRTQGLTATFGDGHRPLEHLLHWTALAQAAGPDEAPPPATAESVLLPDAAGGTP